ncbi:unnamed protein product [Symbiodinium sp. CCMP2456]|nr:unnamed protein product [Symbiodinium sp. CCMP2456]
MAQSGSDTEELFDGFEHSTLSWRRLFPRRVVLVLTGVGLVAATLLSQRGTRSLRSKREFVGLDAACLEMGMFYADPHKMDNTERTVEASAEACKQRCGSTPGCEHFTFWPDGGCLLTDASSTAKAAPYMYSDTVSGPVSCQEESSTSDTKTSPDEAKGNLVNTVQPIVAALPGINGTLCSSYPACMAVGISEGSCCPNDDKVSLGCCSGFPPKLPELKVAAGTECSAFPACARMNMTGACCPAADGVRLSCCDEITSV